MKIYDFKKREAIEFDTPVRVVEPYSWVEHIPFAFLLVDIVKPKVLVELGVHSGNSFNAFCQAVKALNINTLCYGVDTWKGDKHVGFYDLAIYEELLQYQQENYGEFSHLLKMTFDEALQNFADGSLDILHVDGFHTYEAVKHDFENWLPKMSERGVIILHDTSVMEKDFGVWKLWEEICRNYPHFEFKHGYGLGVLAVGKNIPLQLIDFINKANENTFYRKYFHKLGSLITRQIEIQMKDEQIRQRDEQLKQKDEQIMQKDEQIREITGSMAWWAVVKVRSLLPFGAKRKFFYTRIKNAVRVIRTEGFIAFWKRLKQKIRNRIVGCKYTNVQDNYGKDLILENRRKNFRKNRRPTRTKIFKPPVTLKTDREELRRILREIKNELLNSEGLSGDISR